MGKTFFAKEFGGSAKLLTLLQFKIAAWLSWDFGSTIYFCDAAFTLVTVDALPFGQIWFRSVIRVRRTGVLKDRATGEHLPYRSLQSGYILHGQLTEPRAASKERLKSRRPFVPAARKLLHNLSELGIHAAQWTNLTYDTEYSESMSALCICAMVY